jgi:hypothetical protein
MALASGTGDGARIAPRRGARLLWGACVLWDLILKRGQGRQNSSSQINDLPGFHVSNNVRRSILMITMQHTRLLRSSTARGSLCQLVPSQTPPRRRNSDHPPPQPRRRGETARVARVQPAAAWVMGHTTTGASSRLQAARARERQGPPAARRAPDAQPQDAVQLPSAAHKRHAAPLCKPRVHTLASLDRAMGGRQWRGWEVWRGCSGAADRRRRARDRRARAQRVLRGAAPGGTGRRRRATYVRRPGFPASSGGRLPWVEGMRQGVVGTCRGRRRCG